MNQDERSKFNERLPRTAVSERSQAGRTFSYLPGHYVIRRMNEILGNGGWSYHCTTRLLVDEERTSDKGKRWHVSYSSSCTLTVDGCTITDVGHGHGIDKDRGLSHESAEKEAATDSLKRCCRALGDATGLALYDPTQENVVDDRSAAKSDALIAALTSATSWEALKAARVAFEGAEATLTKEDAARVNAAGLAAKTRLEKEKTT